MRTLTKSLVRPTQTLTIDRDVRSSSVVLYLHDGNKRGESHQDSYFRSVNPSYYCQYFENWQFMNSQRWYLERAYLHVYRRPDDALAPLVQYLCLHIDPLEVSGNRHWKVKRALHFHVLTSLEPLPHLHLAIDRVGAANMLRSIGFLDQRLVQAIRLVRHQLLDFDRDAADQLDL